MADKTRSLTALLVGVCLLSAAMLCAEAGDYQDMGGGWTDIGGLTALDGKLYII